MQTIIIKTDNENYEYFYFASNELVDDKTFKLAKGYEIISINDGKLPIDEIKNEIVKYFEKMNKIKIKKVDPYDLKDDVINKSVV